MSFLQQIINGIVLGHVYALIAFGWTILLGSARLVNFSHGELYMVGAFISWWAASSLGISYGLSLILASVGGGLIGLFMQRAMLKPTIEQNLVTIMIMTLGFGYIMQGVAAIVFGSVGQILDTSLVQRDFEIVGVWMTWQDVFIVLITILMFLFIESTIHRTKAGRYIRMVAEDPRLAMLSGVNIRSVYYGVFAFEGVAVALAGGLVAPRTPILTSMGFEELIITFAVVVLGGVGSVKGSYLAGLGLGMFVALFGAFISPAYSLAGTFVLLIAVLVLRPSGIGGTRGIRL